ncbi:MAG: metal-dependent transcriptional regulator [Lachnospiraceae bacterium]|nr:metal-dependent transcriptional regulator [Lachnospiraceae bacterium]
MGHNESLEDYLETILILSKTRPVVRSIDIANELGYKKSSISVAVRNMKEKEYIEVSEEGFINLTKSGKKLAKSVYERHLFFTQWLRGIGVDEKTADEDACSIEHVISEKTFKAIRKFVEESGALSE